MLEYKYDNYVEDEEKQELTLPELPKSSKSHESPKSPELLELTNTEDESELIWSTIIHCAYNQLQSSYKLLTSTPMSTTTRVLLPEFLRIQTEFYKQMKMHLIHRINLILPKKQRIDIEKIQPFNYENTECQRILKDQINFFNFNKEGLDKILRCHCFFTANCAKVNVALKNEQDSRKLVKIADDAKESYKVYQKYWLRKFYSVWIDQFCENIAWKDDSRNFLSTKAKVTSKSSKNMADAEHLLNDVLNNFSLIWPKLTISETEFKLELENEFTEDYRLFQQYKWLLVDLNGFDNKYRKEINYWVK